MKQVTLQVPDKKYPVFMELVRSNDYIKVVQPKVEDDEPSKEEILAGIKQSVKEVNLILAGKLKGIPAKDLLNEL